jgi:hypothetical protein
VKLLQRMTLLALALVIVPKAAFAGTTGGLSGTVLDAETHAPIAGVKVTAISPSQTVTGFTDSSGHFAFVSLAPDEYTVTLEKTGYDSLSYAGASVFADAQQTLSFSMRKTLKTIANVTSRSASSLVRPGTTADLYSVNAEQQRQRPPQRLVGDRECSGRLRAREPGGILAGRARPRRRFRRSRL